jgi:hypothetical protein
MKPTRIDSWRITCTAGMRPSRSNWSAGKFQMKSARPASSSVISVAESGTKRTESLPIAGRPFGLSA